MANYCRECAYWSAKCDIDTVFAWCGKLREVTKWSHVCSEFRMTNLINEADDDFVREPPEDAVFVVRCKDCKYAAQDKMFGDLYCNSRKKCGGKRIEEDYYCADGVRKERNNG